MLTAEEKRAKRAECQLCGIDASRTDTPNGFSALKE